jgi:hypothetical protein
VDAEPAVVYAACMDDLDDAKLEVQRAVIADGLASGVARDGSRRFVHRQVQKRAADKERTHD